MLDLARILEGKMTVHEYIYSVCNWSTVRPKIVCFLEYIPAEGAFPVLDQDTSELNRACKPNL